MADTVTDFLRSEAELVLTEARRKKSERIKTLGNPILLPGKPLDIHVRDQFIWIAESTHVAKKIDLETGKVLQIYRGHTGPVTTLAFYQCSGIVSNQLLLITGSWDQTIKLWNTATKELVSSTSAHSDFVKCLFVFPSLQLLISTSSDKTVKIWDLSTASEGTPLACLGSFSSHTRPVECIDGTALSDSSAVLITADTMGVIKIWEIKKDIDRWRVSPKSELNHHRTRINQITYGSGYLWSASSDDTAQIIPDAFLFPNPSSPVPLKPPRPISHPTAVRCILPLSLTDLAEPYIITGSGDVIRIFDIASLEEPEPELVGLIDGHWHDVIGLQMWMRRLVGADGRTRIEPWIISSSLDGTIRKWRLSELLTSLPLESPDSKPLLPAPAPASTMNTQFELTKEEEDELAELLDSD